MLELIILIFNSNWMNKIEQFEIMTLSLIFFLICSSSIQKSEFVFSDSIFSTFLSWLVKATYISWSEESPPPYFITKDRRSSALLTKFGCSHKTEQDYFLLAKVARNIKQRLVTTNPLAKAASKIKSHKKLASTTKSVEIPFEEVKGELNSRLLKPNDSKC